METMKIVFWKSQQVDSISWKDDGDIMTKKGET